MLPSSLVDFLFFAFSETARSTGGRPWRPEIHCRLTYTLHNCSLGKNLHFIHICTQFTILWLIMTARTSEIVFTDMFHFHVFGFTGNCSWLLLQCLRDNSWVGPDLILANYTRTDIFNFMTSYTRMDTHTTKQVTTFCPTPKENQSKLREKLHILAGIHFGTLWTAVLSFFEEVTNWARSTTVNTSRLGTSQFISSSCNGNFFCSNL